MQKHWIVKHEPMAGFSLSNIARLLWHVDFQLHPKYWLRFFYALVLSCICLPFRLIEFLRFHRKIKRTQPRPDPIFIIGHWRSGTTYLNTLLTLDKSKAFVSNKETYCPHFFLAFPKLVRFIITHSLPETRPMDKIKIGPDLPGEEEHSLGAYDKYGFFHSMIFPGKFDFFTSFLSFKKCPSRELKRWKKRYYYFVQKMTLISDNRPIIFKNPANSYRIKYLQEMFPRAKFIHLYRNPYEVYTSTLRFHHKTCEVFALQNWDYAVLKHKVGQLYAELYRSFDRTKADIPADNFIDVRYEDFIQHTLKTLEGIYTQFDWPGFEKLKPQFRDYIQSQRTYKPAQYRHSQTTLEEVNKRCDHILSRFNYPRQEHTSP